MTSEGSFTSQAAISNECHVRQQKISTFRLNQNFKVYCDMYRLHRHASFTKPKKLRNQIHSLPTNYICDLFSLIYSSKSIIGIYNKRFIKLTAKGINFSCKVKSTRIGAFDPGPQIFSTCVYLITTKYLRNKQI